MENASKALLMAAGVLIGVLIMSLAVYLFVSFGATSADVHEKVRINQINKFNSQFTKYEGKEEVTIHDVISVAKLAKDLNTKNEYTNTDKNYIRVYLDNNIFETLTDNEYTNKIKYMLQNNSVNEKRYDCKITIDSASGFVNKVEFTEK